MAEYFVNQSAQANGDHEVHAIGCLYMPSPLGRQYLGNFPGCAEAIAAASRIFPQSNGCYTCCRPCHLTMERGPARGKDVC